MAWMEFGTVVLEDTYPTVADAATATREFLLTRSGNTEWAVDTAMTSATYDRAWWSDSYHGFTHDCSQHTPKESSPETCFADRREVTVVNGSFGNL